MPAIILPNILITSLGVLFVFLMTNENYLAAAVTYLVLYLGNFSIERRTKDNIRSFGAVLSSLVGMTILLTVIASFGYVNLVSWWVIVPALICAYLVDYMRLRIGIASSKAVKPNSLETVGVPGLVFFSLVCAAAFPYALFIRQNLSQVTFLIILLIFIYIVGRTIRLAYTRTHSAKATTL
jgi:hypothetical protein